MKKIVYYILSILLVGVCFTSCKDEIDSGNISLLVSEMYGTIKPVDIYIIKDGYMEGWNNNKKVSLKKKYNYCAYNYTSSKTTQKNDVSLLKVNKAELKLTIWDKRDNAPADGFTFEEDRVYYSEYWGAKTRVSFVANVSFYKTMHISLEEKSDTYKITYYGQDYSGIYGVSLAFENIKSLDKYKKVIEVPKSDITKIEYIV